MTIVSSAGQNLWRYHMMHYMKDMLQRIITDGFARNVLRISKPCLNGMQFPKTKFVFKKSYLHIKSNQHKKIPFAPIWRECFSLVPSIHSMTSPLLIRLFQLRDIQLHHFHHGLHYRCYFVWVFISLHFHKNRRHYLPCDPKLICQPATLYLLASFA